MKRDNRRKEDTNGAERVNVTPDWVKKGRMVWTTPCHEAPCWYRRKGAEPAELNDFLDWIGSDKFMEIYADAGVNTLYPYFFKGFGIQTERRVFPQLKRMIDNAHKHGIAVTPYTQFDSIVYESILDEAPEAAGWHRKTYSGQPVTYGSQYYRWKPCPSNSGFIDYLKKVIDVSILELGCDGIFFDNFSYIGDINPNGRDFEVCHCNHCQKGFLEFLRKKYPGDPYATFGIPTFDHVRIPPDYLNQADPMVREFWHFANDLLKRTLTELYSHMKSLKKDAALGTNSAALPFINPYDFKGISDMVCWEDHSYPRIEDGCIISQVHQCKTANAQGSNLVKLAAGRPVNPDGKDDYRLGMAEAMAYGSHTPQLPINKGPQRNLQGTWPYSQIKEYTTFFLNNKDIYLEPENAATVAILYNYHSFVRNFHDAYACIKGIQQVCLLNHMPFDLIFTEDLCEDSFIRERLPDYDTLIITDAAFIPNTALHAIRRFVRNGGGLVATGETSLCDSVFRRQKDYLLSDVFGISSKDIPVKGGIFHINPFGKGLSAFSPEVPEKVQFLEPGSTLPLKRQNSGFQKMVKFMLTEQSSAITEAIKSVSKRGLPIQLQAPAWITVDTYRKGGSVFIHLLNHNHKEPAGKMRLDVKHWFKRPVSVDFHTPETGTQKLGKEEESHSTRIIIPGIDVYGLVELK